MTKNSTSPYEIVIRKGSSIVLDARASTGGDETRLFRFFYAHLKEVNATWERKMTQGPFDEQFQPKHQQFNT